MLFTPLHDRVLVRRIEGDEKTSGGIIIPDPAKEKPQEGKIVSVGAGAKDDGGKRIAMDVKAGDKILFGKWSGTEIKIDGEELLIMKESDILGILACTSHLFSHIFQLGLPTCLQKTSNSARTPVTVCSRASTRSPMP